MAHRSSIGEVARSLRAAIRVLTKQPRYLIYALLVHAGFLVMFILSFELTTNPIVAPPQVDVIQAVAVDETEVQRELDRLREAEERKQAEEVARIRRQEEQARRAEEQRRQAEAERRREEQRLAEARRQQEQEQRQAEERRAEEQRQAEAEARREEQQRQAEAEARREEEQRQAAEQRRREEAEAQRREEQRLAEERRREEEEAARRREEERQAELRRQEEAEARRREEARRAEEQRRLDEMIAAERAQREQSEVERYVAMIRQRVERNWNRPPAWSADAGIRCTVRVNLIPGGDVVNVRIVESCGNPIFDSSVESAVYRAAPFSVPSADSGLFERFRELEFVFNPRG